MASRFWFVHRLHMPADLYILSFCAPKLIQLLCVCMHWPPQRSAHRKVKKMANIARLAELAESSDEEVTSTLWEAQRAVVHQKVKLCFGIWNISPIWPKLCYLMLSYHILCYRSVSYHTSILRHLTLPYRILYYPMLPCVRLSYLISYYHMMIISA